MNTVEYKDSQASIHQSLGITDERNDVMMEEVVNKIKEVETALSATEKGDLPTKENTMGLLDGVLKPCLSDIPQTEAERLSIWYWLGSHSQQLIMNLTLARFGPEALQKAVDQLDTND
jgi:hypothetical protein